MRTIKADKILVQALQQIEIQTNQKSCTNDTHTHTYIQRHIQACQPSLYHVALPYNNIRRTTSGKHKKSQSKKKKKRENKTVEASLLSIFHIYMHYIHQYVEAEAHTFHVFAKKKERKGTEKREKKNSKAEYGKKNHKEILFFLSIQPRQWLGKIIEIEKNIIKNGIKVGILILRTPSNRK